MKKAQLEECLGEMKTTSYVNNNIQLGSILWYKGIKWIVTKIYN